MVYLMPLKCEKRKLIHEEKLNQKSADGFTFLSQFSAEFLSLDWMMLPLLALSIRLLQSSLLVIVNSVDGVFLSL